MTDFESEPIPLNNPQEALTIIRDRMVSITQEYSSGQLNAAQFNAIYRHYSEKRKIIELLIARDPHGDAWRKPATSGLTSYLRQQYEAHVMAYLVFKRTAREPLLTGGQMPRSVAQQVYKLLQVVWSLQTWKPGLARKAMGNGRWTILVAGKQAYTLVVYTMQPSTLQVDEVRDLHLDFERANQYALHRGEAPARMVFPQRELLES